MGDLDLLFKSINCQKRLSEIYRKTAHFVMKFLNDTVPVCESPVCESPVCKPLWGPSVGFFLDHHNLNLKVN